MSRRGAQRPAPDSDAGNRLGRPGGAVRLASRLDDMSTRAAARAGTATGRSPFARWRARQRRPGWWRALITAGVPCLGAGVAGVVFHFAPPGAIGTLFLSAVSPVLGVGALVSLALFAGARRATGWVGVAASVVVLGANAAVQAPLFAPAAASASGPDVVVMTLNMRLGQADPQAVVAAVRRDAVRVLMLEELTPEARQALAAAGLDRALPHSVVAAGDGASGVGLWSSYPLRHRQIRNDFTFELVTARVAVPGMPTGPTAMATHMAGPFPRDENWHRDIARLPGVLQALPADAPVLVGGDFNSTLDVTQFRALLTGGYADAGSQAGAGFLPTYPADTWYPPIIGIDHVLTRDAVGRSARTIEVPGSDHRGLVVHVRLNRTTGR